MKKFLIISGSFLVGALVATVLVFWYVTVNLPAAPKVPPNESLKEDIPAAPTTTVTTDSVVAEPESNKQPELLESPELPTVPAAGIALRDVPLSDGQRTLLAGVGIEVETFVITPAMQRCAESTLGAVRLQAIIGGAAPSVLETTRLLPCLRVD